MDGWMSLENCLIYLFFINFYTIPTSYEMSHDHKTFDLVTKINSKIPQRKWMNYVSIKALQMVPFLWQVNLNLNFLFLIHK